jgi:phosphoketolase
LLLALQHWGECHDHCQDSPDWSEFEMPVQGEGMMANVLSNNERALIHAYWRAANYLSVGQIYLYDNPLLKQTLTKDHITHQSLI